MRIADQNEVSRVQSEKSNTKQVEQLEQLKISAEFWPLFRKHLAQCLGLNKHRIFVFADFAYARIKSDQSSTAPHCDFYHFLTQTDLLQRLGRPASTGLCALCQRRPGVKFPQVSLCRVCANRDIPLYTAWISLGNYQNRIHSLLEYSPGSLLGDFSKINHTMTRQLPIGSQKWQHCTDNHLDCYDMVLFNCKIAHRALAATATTARFSLDVRFMIVEDG